MCYYELYVSGTIIDVDISSSLCCMFWTTDYRAMSVGSRERGL